MNFKSPFDKLVKARVQLVFKHPFFAALCLRLQLVPSSVKTMATDGRCIRYSEQFVDSVTPDQLEGVLAHEALHCALGHHCRRGSRTPKRWNHACDYAINPVLIENGFELPPGGLLRDDFVGLSAEEIYARLAPETGNSGTQRDPEQGDNGNDSGSSSPQSSSQKPAQDDKPEQSQQASAPNQDDPGDPSSAGQDEYGDTLGEVCDAVNDQGGPASEPEKTEQQRDWAIAAQQAANAAKSCGHLPLGAERVLEDSLRSHQDWRAILRDFVAATTPSDFRFSPPNRRYVHAGIYLPSIHKEGTGSIVIAVDTSGSIGADELRLFAGEIAAIAEDAQPETIHVVYCDARVQRTQEFAPAETIVLTPKGGGGTNFRPVFDWVDEHDLNPACLIYLTDLCCNSYPAATPPYPVLWVTDSRRIAPWGDTVQIVPDYQ